MTTTFLFSNNLQSTLAFPVLITDTTITVASGTGSYFPNPISGQTLPITLVSALNPMVKEIVYCISITGDIFTVTRAQEGTIALDWNKGDFVANLFTAGCARNFVQIPQLGVTGTANNTNTLTIVNGLITNIV